MAPSSLTIRDRSYIMMVAIMFAIISMLDVFGQPLLSNAAAEALSTAKNVCVRLRTSFLYIVFINVFICVGEYPNKKQNSHFFSSNDITKVQI